MHLYDSIDTSFEIPKVLIVDDQGHSLDLLERMLEKLDVDIFRATSGPEAIRMAVENQFSLVLLDIHMPEMDGYEAAYGLRATDGNQDLSIIFITADMHQKKNFFQGYEQGAVDYLFKPFEKTLLLSKVRLFCKLHTQKILLEQKNRLLATENQRNLQRIQVMEEYLENLKNNIIQESNELINKVKRMDRHSKKLSQFGHVPNKKEELRENLIKLTNITLEYWEQTTGKSKIELAEESNLWSVSREGSAPRVKTLDRYLHLNSLPAKPRWRNVIETTEYVLNEYPAQSQLKTFLESKLISFRSQIQEQNFNMSGKG